MLAHLIATQTKILNSKLYVSIVQDHTSAITKVCKSFKTHNMDLKTWGTCTVLGNSNITLNNHA